MPGKVNIMIMSGIDDGKVIGFDINDLIQDAIRIGRSEDNDIVLTSDPAISRHHAILHWNRGQWLLEDCDSKNGTFTEGSKIMDRDVRVIDDVSIVSGMMFRVGMTWLRFQTYEWETNA